MAIRSSTDRCYRSQVHNNDALPNLTQLPSLMSVPADFQELVASRRAWIDEVLRPWCQQASQKELRQVEQEWLDIAGRVDAQATLWTWAWERFDALTWPDLAGVNETRRVVVTLKDGTSAQGWPDSRASVRGNLVLVDRTAEGSVQHGPWSIDNVQSASVLEEE